MNRTMNSVQKVIGMRHENGEDKLPNTSSAVTQNLSALTDAQLKSFMDRVGRVCHFQGLRRAVAAGGVEPSLRRVVWRLLLGVFCSDLSGAERLAFMARCATEYRELKTRWKKLHGAGQLSAGHMCAVTAIGKDVIRTDRKHPFFAADSSRSTQLFDLLVTFAIYHPSVGYAQGMSDLASPLLIVQQDEAAAYVCFCALMRRLGASFRRESSAMLTKLQHLHDMVVHLDPALAVALRQRNMADMWWAHRWLLLELKREFTFEDTLHILEVQWAQVPFSWLFQGEELALVEGSQDAYACLHSPVASSSPKDTPYLRLASLRHQSTHSRRHLMRSDAIVDTAFPFDENHVRQSSSANGAVASETAADSAGGSFIIFKDKVTELAPPEQLGVGNPFLLFLCFALAQLYRERILASCHDLCDISTFFTRTQRKHDLSQLLSRARSLFQTYLCATKQQQQQKDHAEQLQVTF